MLIFVTNAVSRDECQRHTKLPFGLLQTYILQCPLRWVAAGSCCIKCINRFRQGC
jgi:hypothetical protein